MRNRLDRDDLKMVRQLERRSEERPAGRACESDEESRKVRGALV